MIEYKVSKETLEFITNQLVEPSNLLHTWHNWLSRAGGLDEAYKAIDELNDQPNARASEIITQLLMGTAKLVLKEKKYRVYHKQNSGVMSFAYHYFTKSGTLQDSDDFDDVSILTESNVNALAHYEGKWVWEWAHEEKDND